MILANFACLISHLNKRTDEYLIWAMEPKYVEVNDGPCIQVYKSPLSDYNSPGGLS